MKLDNGSRVAVVGGGPAGSFFTIFLLEMAARAGLRLDVDIYELKNYQALGATGCNMCGGIISESLVQLLATEGINLPPTVVQRGIDSYRLHLDVGAVTITTPHNEGRIAAVHRGAGPRGHQGKRWESFDDFLLNLARTKGASIVRERVEDVDFTEPLPRIVTAKGTTEPYELVAVATGVNSGAGKLLEKFGPAYRPPKTTKTAVSEFCLGAATVQKYFGNSMHMFLLNMPNLEFGAIIPKGEYVTVVLLGREVDKQLVTSFLNAPEVRACFPPDWTMPAEYCRCFPSINVRGPAQPFADRLVFIGDCGESRLYKDGIGGAYRTAKAAAKTALFEGVSAEAFRRRYLPVCRDLAVDNAVGKFIFFMTGALQRLQFTRWGLLRMVEMEQKLIKRAKRMSNVLWDLFTGSAPYREVFLRTLHPFFTGRLVLATLDALVAKRTREETVAGTAGASGDLGRVYRAGETILRQGETGDAMFIIQSGTVEVLRELDGSELCLLELGNGEFFGEAAMFEDGIRTATVRALTDTRILTVDRRVLLRKVHEDPSLAFRIMGRLTTRITDLGEQLMSLNEARVEDSLNHLIRRDS
jgi:flavin-dependent dehydrogenase